MTGRMGSGNHTDRWSMWLKRGMNLKRPFIILLMFSLLVGVVSASVLTITTTNTTDGLTNGAASAGTTFTAARANTGTAVDLTSTTVGVYLREHSSVSGKYNLFRRGHLIFNTSALPDNAVIDSAIIGLYRSSSENQLGGTPAIGLTGWTPTTPGIIVRADYNKFQDVRYATDIAYSGLSGTRYYNWTLNSAGLANISKTGFTNIMVRNSWDIDNNYGGNAWAGGKWMYYSFVTSEYGSRKPFIEITYHTSTDPVAAFTGTPLTGAAPLNVMFTDSSSGSITSRRWDFGDGNISTYTVATNPSHSYISDGLYSVNLTVSNATGSNSLLRSNYVLVSASPPADITPPAGLTGLHATNVTNSSIVWNATLPADSDFNKTIVLKNGVWFENWSNTTNSKVWAGLSGATSYTISTRTCDLLENCNLTWQNSTAVTLGNPVIPEEGAAVLTVTTTNASDGLTNGAASAGTTFTAARAGAGSNSDLTSSTIGVYLREHTTSSGKYNLFRRGMLIFNTSALPDNAIIDSAVIGTWESSFANQLGGTPGIGITGFTPATPGTIVTADYNKFQDVRYASDIPYTSLTQKTNNWTLNAAGIANISKTGFTNIMVRNSWDIDNNYGGNAWVGGKSLYYSFVASEYGSKKPFIEITYHTSNVPVAAFTGTPLTGTAPLNVSFTDTSSGASISNRRWDFGDGNISNYSVATNPYHSYASDGTYSVNLTVTNATGSNSLLRSNYITVTPLPADMTPPAGLSNLQATVVTNSSIVWNATLPADSDFNNTVILKNGVWFENWSNTTSSSVWTGLTDATSYTISTRTCDRLENCNLTWQNSTAVTASTPPSPPDAGFSSVLLHNTMVQFTDTSSNAPTSWFWDFGDGNISTSQNPVHTFGAYQSYSVNLTATNTGGSDSEVKNIDVEFVSTNKITVYANTALDGRSYPDYTNNTWSSLKARAGNGYTSANPSTSVGVGSDLATDRFKNIYRFVWSGDTSVLNDDAIIDSVVFGVWGDIKTSDLGITNISVIDSYRTNPTTLEVTDFSKTSLTRLSDYIRSENWITGGYNNFTITNSSFINKTGMSSLGLAIQNDIENIQPAWAPSASTRFYFMDSSQSGLAQDPFLEITYHLTNSAPPGSLTNISHPDTCTSIHWKFDIPGDPDYKGVMIWKNGVFLHNLTSTATSDLWEGMESNVSYTFSSKTFDGFGNVDTDFANSTVTTPAICTSPDWPKVMILTDDGRISIWNNMAPVLHAYGYNATVFAVGSFTDNEGGSKYISWDQLSTLYGYGWDIGSHTLDHPYLNAVNATEQKRQMGDMINKLDSHGFTRSSHHLAYPYGEYSDEVMVSAASVGVLSARVTDASPVISPYHNLLNYTYDESIDQTITLDQIKNIIDEGTTNQTIVLLLHDVGDGTDYYFWPTENFQELIEYIHQKNLHVVTVSEWYDYNGVATKPDASFTDYVPNSLQPFTIQFTDTSTNAPKSWLWEFGDGTTSTSQNPIHTYPAYQTYLVNLTATNIGGSDSESKIIEVKDIPITNNFDLGWHTHINNDYSNGSSINNTFIASGSFTTDLTGETLTQNLHDLTWDIASGPIGELYIGQLYPAGHTKYRFNVSVIRNPNDVNNPYIHIYNGKLFDILVYGSATGQTAYLQYYDSGGTIRTDKYITVNKNYIDFTAEYFPDGTTILTNNLNPGQSVSTKYHLDNYYPYNYISTPIIQVQPGLNGGTSMKVILYNFEQSVPKKLVTVWADNTKFPFGFDGVRQNYSAGTDWLKSNNQRATLWMEPDYYDDLTTSQKSDVQDLIRNQGFELGNHFTHKFTDLSYAAALAEMASETSSIESTFGTKSLSWESLGNGENSTHASVMWTNYSSLWRNAPNSNAGSYGSGIYAIYSQSTVSTSDNTRFWNVASQYKSFNPSYTHSVNNPLTESSSVNTNDFGRIMGNYTSRGVKIVPYAEWYYENMNSVQPITNVNFSQADSHFNIDTNGYNATTTIYDPNSEGVWYSDGGVVITNIDNTAVTNLTVKTPSDLTVKKANALFTVSSDNILVNVTEWNTAGDYYKKWNESSIHTGITTHHTIGDFANNQEIRIKKNGVNWNTYTSNATGYITFIYTGGYSSDIQFETQIL